MKPGRVISLLCCALVIAPLRCMTTVVRPADVVVAGEDAAIVKLADDINTVRILLYNKKIGVFYFTTLDWEIIDAGKRISGKLSDYLARKVALPVIPQARLYAIMKTEAIEQASIFDVEAIQKREKELKVDVIITGTISHSKDGIQIELKTVDVATGRMMLLSGVRMPATGEYTFKENPDLVQLNRKSPGKIAAMNKTYFLLQWMKANQPLVFLLSVLKDSELKSLRTTNPVLSGKLAVRNERYEQQRPEIIKKIKGLRDALSLMERYEIRRFGEIMKWKKELLDWMK